MNTKSKTPWLVRTQPEDAQIAVKLYCVPHGGGSAATFRTWGAALPPHIQVNAVQLPGRFSNSRLPPFIRMEPLAEALADVIAADAGDLPYALFGHCSGALIGFEVGQRLARRDRGPIHLFASSSLAPPLTPIAASGREYTDDDLIAILCATGGTPQEVLASRALLRLLLPAVRADFVLAESYACDPTAVVDCDATCIVGADDDIDQQDLLRWRQFVTGHLTLQVLAGGHFFAEASRIALLEYIARTLPSSKA